MANKQDIETDAPAPASTRGSGHPPDSGSDRLLMAELVKLRPQLYTRAMQLMSNTAAADDLVQDALERAIRNRASFRSGTSLTAWVGTILRNLAIDRWRSPVPVSVDPDTLPCRTLEPAGRDPLDLISLGDLRSAVAGLSARDRQLFELAYFQRIRHREIALKLRARVNTVGTQVFRAKAKVRAILEEIYRRRLAHAPQQSLMLVQNNPEPRDETKAPVARSGAALATRPAHQPSRSADPGATPGRRSRTHRAPANRRERRPSNG